MEATDAVRLQSTVTLGVVPNIENRKKDTVMASQVFSQGEQAFKEEGNAMGVIINPKPFSSVVMGLAASMRDIPVFPDDEEQKMPAEESKQ